MQLERAVTFEGFFFETASSLCAHAVPVWFCMITLSCLSRYEKIPCDSTMSRLYTRNLVYI